MINLLYVILIAMLAINVASETLDAYTILNDDSIQKVEKLRTYNQALSDSISRIHPENASALRQIRKWSDTLITHIEDLQREIVRQADDIEEGTPELIPNKKEDLNSVPNTMLSVASHHGANLKKELAVLRDSLCRLTGDAHTQQMISTWLTMEKRGFATSWEKGTFSNMSAIGGITYLNILKENVLLASAATMKGLSPEQASLASAQKQALLGDTLMMKGESSVENIKQMTQIIKTILNEDVNSKENYVLVNNRPVAVRTDGKLELPFINLESQGASQIYADYENVISLHAVGSTPEELSVTAKNGKVTVKGNQCTIIPNKNARTVEVSVGQRRFGAVQPLAEKTFVVKPLPEAEPYLVYEENGSLRQCKGNTPLAISSLIRAKRIGAFIGTPINENIRVNGFEVVLVKNNQSSKILSAKSNSDAVTSAQLDILKQAQNGDQVYITSIKSQTPTKKVINLPSISIIVY